MVSASTSKCTLRTLGTHRRRRKARFAAWERCSSNITPRFRADLDGTIVMSPNTSGRGKGLVDALDDERYIQTSLSMLFLSMLSRSHSSTSEIHFTIFTTAGNWSSLPSPSPLSSAVSRPQWLHRLKCLAIFAYQLWLNIVFRRKF